jgi:hypothetical protein
MYPAGYDNRPTMDSQQSKTSNLTRSYEYVQLYISSQKSILTWAGIELLLVSDIPPKGLYKGDVTLPDLPR